MSALNELRGSNNDRWPNIAAAEVLSAQKMSLLSDAVKGLLPTDEGGLIVFGSLARGEFTEGSDLDWAVLIDSQANSEHLQVARSVKNKITDAGFPKPGPTGVFGGLVFSHDLIHAIGGDDDTNTNMTRRLLLLLESTPVSNSASQDVHNRIISGIVARYVDEDASFIRPDEQKGRIPRFLLNDVVRFWRTMAVDYANKHRERGGDKWALRNIKLRMSRKLLFVSGLFMCITWALDNNGPDTGGFRNLNLQNHLIKWTRRPPLESLASLVKDYGPDLAEDVLGSYDEFLAILSNDSDRKALEGLSPEEAYRDPVFLRARDIAMKFDGALLRLMFDSDRRIADLVRKYGVF